MAAITRRRVLSQGAIAALCAPVIAAAPTALGSPPKPGHDMPAFGAAGDDAELMALVAEFWRHNAGLDAWNAGHITEEIGEQHNRAWWACCRAMTPIVPQTAAGKAAKAAVALVALEMVQDDQHDVEKLVRASLAENGRRPQSGATRDPDAELIAICDRIAATYREQRLICIADPWAPDKGPHHARWEALWHERQSLEDRLYDTETPVTIAGAQAAARAALAGAERTNKGELTYRHETDWLLLALAEFHAGSAFEEELARLARSDNQAGSAVA